MTYNNDWGALLPALDDPLNVVNGVLRALGGRG